MGWDKPLKKSTVIVIVEISMLLGFVLALFMVPGSTPLRTFLIICGVAFLFFNALFFWGFKRKSSLPGTSEGRRKTTYVIWILLALCVLAQLLFRMLRSH